MVPQIQHVACGLRFLRLPVVPLAPQVPRATCGSLWAFEAPLVSVVPWVHCSSHGSAGSLDCLWFLGSMWFLLFPVVPVVP